MSNWIERLQEEKNELALKLMKLDEFLCGSKVKTLQPADIFLLHEQQSGMEALLEILEARLKRITEAEEEERMKNIVRNGNDGKHYSETEYLTSSKANTEHLEKAMKEFDKSCDEHLDKVAETKITPKSLLELGFKEVYQGVDYGEPGYIFYSLDIKGVGFCSVDTESKDFHVRLDHDDYPIHNLKKLKDLITALNELV